MSAATGGDGPGPLNGLVIPANVDQPLHVADFRADGQPVYRALQGHVGGTIDVIGFDEGDIWVNDVGRLINLPSTSAPATGCSTNPPPDGPVRSGKPHRLRRRRDLRTTDRDGDSTAVSPELVTYFESLQLNPNAMKDWDVRKVETIVTSWPDLQGFAPGIDL